MNLIVFSLCLLVGTGVLALFCSRQPLLSTAVGTLGAVAAGIVGLIPSVGVLLGVPAAAVQMPWALPSGELLLGVDALSALFLVPLYVLASLAAIYGRHYMLAYSERTSLGPPVFFFNVLIASMVLVVVAQGAVLLLMAWEVMTIASYLLVSFEHHEPEVRRAGWVYLVAAHVGVVCLFALFLLLDRHAGGASFAAFRAMPVVGAGLGALLFVLALAGFGVKAGLLPFHVWLPEAHAAAPSHVSALMSGVLIKLGLYGVLRTLTFLPQANYWGPTLIVLGLSGAVLGISLAIYQRDIKRVLAYSSVENIGIITLGLGVAYWGASRGDNVVAALGAAGALLHLWNHVMMKGLMFFAAGSILHGCGSKDLEKLGGLIKRMPKTGAVMILGAVAIAGLPPLNGFVGEWLIYLGLIDSPAQGGTGGTLSLLAVGLLALVGSLAALCFVRLIGVSLLGEGRSAKATHAHEASMWMLAPMAVLALACVTVAVIPRHIVVAFTGIAAQLWGAAIAVNLRVVAESLDTLGHINSAVLGALVLFGLVAMAFNRRRAPAVETWGCGYAAPSPRMQYTGRSFADLLAGRFLPSAFRARVIRVEAPATFPLDGGLVTDTADPLTRSVYEPFFAFLANRLARLRWLQQGALHLYVLYILVAVVLAFIWMSLRAWMNA